MSAYVVNHGRIAIALRIVAGAQSKREWREGLHRFADYLETAARRIHFLENHMGQAQAAIAKLETALAAERVNNKHLQAQLDAATASALDDADEAAIAGVDAFIADTTNGAAAGGTTTGSTGTDITGDAPQTTPVPA